jgi:Zn-dependent protease/predicted transcriptional regulator
VRWSWKIASIAGIAVRVHATFLLLLLWVGGAAWLTTRSPMGAVAGIAFVLMLFAIVVLHELGHALAARRYGVGTRDITLLPIGGVSRLERMPERPREELVVALAGPAVNVALMIVLVAIAFAAGIPLAPQDPLAAHVHLVARLFWINAALLVFNLLPAFPMDGGRVLRALLAMRLDHARATQIAASLGKGLAFVIGFIGLFGNPFLVLIAVFVWFGASAEAQSEEVHAALRGLRAGDVMVRRFDTLNADDTFGTAASLALSGFQTSFPVISDHEVIGVMTPATLIRGLSESGRSGKVADMLEGPSCIVEQEEMLEQVFDRMQRTASRAAAVLDHGELVGLLTLEAIGELVAVRSAMEHRKQGWRTGTPALGAG